MYNVSFETHGQWTFLAHEEGLMGNGLAPNATIAIDLVNEQPADDTYVMVITQTQYVLWRPWWQAQVQEQAQRELYGTHVQNHPNSYLVSHWRGVLYDRLQASFQIDARTKDRYLVLIMNTRRALLKLSGSVSLLNPGGEQLVLQWRKVPEVLLWTSALFFGSCLLFAGLLATATRRGRNAMHVVIASVLLLKGIVLLLKWNNRMQVSRLGYDTVLGQLSWQLLEKVQTIMELMMFLLIALGWKLLRGSLNITEMRFAGGISVISFYLGVFEVACTTQSTCSGYTLSRYILHALCYLVVIVAMNFNLQMIAAQISDSTASVDSGKLYRKHHAYQVFRWVFLAFIIAPTVELFLKVTVVPWDAMWLYWLVVELRTWMIYTCVVVTFRPEPPAPRVFELTQTGSDDEDVAEGLPAPAGMAE